MRKYFIKTFGCAANEADSERIASYYQARGYLLASHLEEADDVIINTCMIRQKAEDRVYGLVYNLSKLKVQRSALKIIVTGCMVGMAVRERSGKMLAALKKKMPAVDEFLPIEEVGFEYAPVRTSHAHARVPISNGCNNFCTFCVVPFTRGREVSRPFDDIVRECRELARTGHTHVTLVGQNVNSYGADLILGLENIQVMRDIPGKSYFLPQISKIKYPFDKTPFDQTQGKQGKQKSNIQIKNQKGKDGKLVGFKEKTVQPALVKHLGRLRIPTLFPLLLSELVKIDGIESIDFISSNPWDFSDELIATIAKNPKISRHIHLPVQSGDTDVLRKMNRWYTRNEYLALVKRIKNAIPDATISTDIIVGFCGETKKQFHNTVTLAKKVGFTKAYISMYSDRPMTAAHKAYHDDVPHEEKKRRWKVLEELINRKNLRQGMYR